MTEPSLQRKKIADEVYFNWIIDKKFKHNRISIHCILPLEESTASNNAIVPLLLKRGSKHHPDFATLQAELNRLYGAYVSAHTNRFNAYQRVSLGIQALDNRYAMNKEDLVGRCATLLSQLFFEPNLGEDGLFKEKTVELERQSLIDSIQGEFNDKRTYTINRTLEEMYRGEPVATARLGTEETAQKITPQSATDAWHNMLTHAPIEIMFTGSGDPSSALEVLTEQFAKIKREVAGYSLQTMRDKATEVHTVTEEVEGLQQGKLALGFRAAGLTTPHQKHAARLFSAVYGGTPFSKLFLNVREKMSLCYYCASRMDILNNGMLVDSGVEYENKEAAQKEILAQLKSVQDGNVSEEELTNTKLLMTNAYKNATDTLSATESWYLGQILQGEAESPEDYITQMQAITAEEIVEISKGITLDTVYFLTGKEEQ